MSDSTCHCFEKHIMEVYRSLLLQGCRDPIGIQVIGSLPEDHQGSARLFCVPVKTFVIKEGLDAVLDLLGVVLHVVEDYPVLK